MRIEQILLDDYVDSPDNPRIMFKKGDPAFESLSQSIDEFDYLQPLIVNNRTGQIISGHLRKRVLKSKGIDKAEAVIVDFDTIKQRSAVIAFNKISGSWDFGKLASVLDELSKIPDFDVNVTGFNTTEIGQIFDRYLEPKDADDYDFQSTLDNIVEPVTQKGDLIQLGPHRILCGDSTDSNDFKILMNGEKADILDTDFPYNVSYMQKNNRPSVNTRPKKSRKWDQIYSDSLPQSEYELLMKKVMVNIKNYLKPGSPVYIWQGHRQIPPLYQILLDLGFHTSCIVCWMKEAAVISYADYSFRSEHALYGWLEGAPHYWVGPPGESNVWEMHRDPTKNYIHPTQKPVELAARAIRNSSKRGDIILDTFLGSGSVLIACESLSRRYYGLELDPRFIDGLVFRYINYVGADKVSQDVRAKYLKEA
ncbi:MAG: DNA methyltransferase [Candidatus Omnitrophica bacterium]|nr:DNA methyltransferase [Candidatus Omnitrophota bacterium]